MGDRMPLMKIGTFGEVAAEDDSYLLNYFHSTDAISEIEDENKFLVVGRKGAGKTAVVRYFTEGPKKAYSKALNLRNYPWAVHAEVLDRGMEGVDAYVASWRYLIAVELASFTLRLSEKIYLDSQLPLREYLISNYGSINPSLPEILQPIKLKVLGIFLNPSVLGNSIGGVNLSRESDDRKLGLELNALTDAILEHCIIISKSAKIPKISLHFDELDAGLRAVDSTMKSMLSGLIIAVRDLRRMFIEKEVLFSVVFHLREDLWNSLAFSDKNKITQTRAFSIEWDSEALEGVVEARIRAKLGEEFTWDNIIDDQAVRGSQPKWNHVVARTTKRPRDVIKFLNACLLVAKRRRKQEVADINVKNDDSSGAKHRLFLRIKIL